METGTSRVIYLPSKDCGKYLYVSLSQDTTIYLPLASVCFGGQVEGVVLPCAGDWKLTLACLDARQPRAEKSVVFGAGSVFSAQSTGVSWRITSRAFCSRGVRDILRVS
jgi:hypothetical protein